MLIGLSEIIERLARLTSIMTSEKSYEFSLFNTASCTYVFHMNLFDGCSLTPKLHNIKDSSCVFLAGLEQLSPSKIEQIDELAKKKMNAPEEVDLQLKKEMYVPLPKEKLDENGVKYHQCNVCNLRVIGIEHYSSIEHTNKLNRCEYFQLMMTLVETTEEKPVAGLIPGSGVGLGGKLGKDPKPIRWDLRQKMIPRIGSLPLKVLPIVETCPLQLLLVHSETSRANDPQFGIQCRAGAADIPRVLWNLGLVQNDVQDRIGGHGRRDVTLRSS